MERAASLHSAQVRLGLTVEDVKSYAKAVVHWMAAGYPERTNEEVENLYMTYCEPCKHRVDTRCAKCRCRVSKIGPALTNKLRMATEACPDGKFLAVGQHPAKASPELIHAYEQRS